MAPVLLGTSCCEANEHARAVCAVFVVDSLLKTFEHGGRSFDSLREVVALAENGVRASALYARHKHDCFS